MQTQQVQAQAAMKNECQALTLPAVIQRLTTEQAQVSAELSRMPADAWLNARGRALANREQELFTTLTVLRDMTKATFQIAEPSH
ncbi:MULTISPECIES: hypothetical protein [Comamonas]|uniref:Uncharacterized protein n=1 Tax=Comamonas jiangduensis TaxID=1194168 RepID=A0ABV4IBI6_9BURK|nr:MULTISPECIES: hypothetical protein [Comamonas]